MAGIRKKDKIDHTLRRMTPPREHAICIALEVV
jgi:hypothetical protein